MNTVEPTGDPVLMEKALVELKDWLRSPETAPEFTNMKRCMGDIFEKSFEERRRWGEDPNLNRPFTI